MTNPLFFAMLYVCVSLSSALPVYRAHPLHPRHHQNFDTSSPQDDSLSLRWTSPDTLQSIVRQSAECTIDILSSTPRKVLQVNGTGEDDVTFNVCPMSSEFSGQYIFSSSSSSGEVLQATDVNLVAITSQTSICTNVTVDFLFDDMVGRTTYTLAAKTKESDEVMCSASIGFIVAGLTVFEESFQTTTQNSNQLNAVSIRSVPSDANPNVIRTIFSGTDNGVVTNYRDVITQDRRDLLVKIQFLDGTDSTTRTSDFVRAALEDLSTSASVDRTSPVRFDPTACNEIPSNLDSYLSTSSSCGASFALGGNLLFGVRYEPYRDGEVDFLYSWPAFTSSDIALVGEEYVNVLRVSIDGDSPPLVESVTFPEIIYRAGGQEVTVVFDNSEGSTSRFLKAGDSRFPEVEGSYRRLENGLYEAKYVILSGNGTDIPWKMEMSYDNERTTGSKLLNEALPKTISYVTRPLQIDSVYPPYVRDEETIVLQGFFDGFNLSKDGHEIFIGEKRLSDLDIEPIISEDKTKIIIKTPVRDDAGEAYEYDIRVVVNDESTGNKAYSYIPIDMSLDIDVVGGTFYEISGEYIFGSCEFSSYLASPISGVATPGSCIWNLTAVDSPTVDLLANNPGLTNGSSLTIEPRMLGSSTDVFSIGLRCIIFELEWTSVVKARKNAAPMIGIDIASPSRRSLSLPRAPVRVVASITFPAENCYDFKTEVVYEWTYDNKTYTLAPRSMIGIEKLDEITATRFGRELFIPLSALKYGNFTIDLVAFVRSDENVRGTGTVQLIVEPPDLVPMIGYGALELQHSINFDLSITSEKSFNPDTPVRKNSDITQREWVCLVSDQLDPYLDRASQCDSRLLPSNSSLSFSIPASALQAVWNEVTSISSAELYVRYILRVGKFPEWSPKVSQTITMSNSSLQYATVNEVRVQNVKGDHLTWTRIPFYEEVVVTPMGKNVSWVYSMSSPKSQQSFFLNDKKVHSLPGYFEPSFEPKRGKLPVGFRRDALLPASPHRIVIMLFSELPNTLDSNVTILLKSVDRPRLELPQLPVREGDLVTAFPASARINLDSANDFQFYFYLVSKEGETTCLDGCSGRSVIRFQIVSTGIYWVMVRLRSSFSTRVLEERYFDRNITVRSAPGVVSIGDGNATDLQLLDMSFWKGDHGTVEQIVTMATKAMQPSLRNGPITGSTAFLVRSMDIINASVSNSMPSTMVARSYLEMSAKLNRVNSNLSTTAFQRTILSFYQYVISRIPGQEAFDIEDSLLEALNSSIGNAAVPFMIAKGSNNTADSAYIGYTADATLEERQLLVDLFGVMRKELSIVLSKNTLCGDFRRVNTAVLRTKPPTFDENQLSMVSVRSRNVKFDFLSSYSKYHIPAVSTFTLGTACSETHIQAPTGDSANLVWCPEVFKAAFEAQGQVLLSHPREEDRLLLSILESPDFLWITGQMRDGMQVETSHLVHIGVGTLRNGAIDAVPNFERTGCYRVNFSTPRLGRAPHRGCQSGSGYLLEEFRDTGNLTNGLGLYDRTGLVDSFVFSTDESSTVMAEISRPGVVATRLANCPQDTVRPIAELPKGPGQFPYMVAASIVGLGLTGALSWFSFTTIAYGSVTAATA